MYSVICIAICYVVFRSVPLVKLYHLFIFTVAVQELKGVAASSGGMWCVLALLAVGAPTGHRQGKEGSFLLSLFVLLGTALGETFSLLVCFYSVALNGA